MISYLSREHLNEVFAYIAKHYSRIEEVPDYISEKTGIEKLCGVLEHAYSDIYYPTVLDKAVHLLVQINKGHFFSNGNKRLALVVTTTFLGRNGFHIKSLEKTDFKDILSNLFPEHTDWKDYSDFTATDFATYHMSIIIAESGMYNIEFDVLKLRVKDFLSIAMEK
jgi:prophage maintenance system killer protein